jgi:hypothetical protein
MTKFRMNKRQLNPNQNHEVHKETCRYYNLLTQYVELGEFVFCSTALQQARALGYTNVDGCKECCEPCHVG